MADADADAEAAADAMLWPEGPASLTLAEVAARAEMPEATVRRARRLIGLADPGDLPVCRPAEVELFRSLRDAIAVFGEEAPLQFARVVGVTTEALAEAAQAMFSSIVERPLRAAGATNEEVEQQALDARLAFGAARLAVDIALRMHFEQTADRFRGDDPEGVEFAIAFVDLVSSTEMAVASDLRQYAAAVRDFEAAAQEIAMRHEVRLVKLIGDAVMLAARDAAPVVAAAERLVETIRSDERFASARGGVAYGSVFARDGDYFGSTVNLAARLASTAAPGVVWVDEAVARSVPDIVDDAGTQHLKGFSEAQRVFALRSPR